jgi:hypothetical protein
LSGWTRAPSSSKRKNRHCTAIFDPISVSLSAVISGQLKKGSKAVKLGYGVLAFRSQPELPGETHLE